MASAMSYPGRLHRFGGSTYRTSTWSAYDGAGGGSRCEVYRHSDGALIGIIHKPSDHWGRYKYWAETVEAEPLGGAWTVREAVYMIAKAEGEKR